MPDWHMKDHNMAKPASDDEYFERMSRVILSSGLNWHVIEKKWPGIKKAFADFAVAKVAQFDEPHIEELMLNPDVIRNMPKLRAIVANAQTVINVSKEYGSFAGYLAAARGAGGEDGLVKDISKKFAFMGPGTTTMFLFAVGEDMPKAMAE